MKLVNYLLLRLLGIMMLVIVLWSVVYFFLQIYEIHDGIDEGLVNLKQEFIRQANTSNGFVEDMEQHNPLNIIVAEINAEDAQHTKEQIYNTEIYFVTEQEEEDVRILETAFFCESNQKYYNLKIFSTTVQSDDLIEKMIYTLTALWVLLAIVLILAGRNVISNAFKPFSRLLKDMQNFHLGKMEMIDFPETPISEFTRLNQSTRQLLENSIQTYAEQKNFIENASHELQTPLAIAIGKLELLIENQKVTREQLVQINETINILTRMKRINSSLLLLSKIKNKQFHENQRINLHDVFMAIMDDYKELIVHKGLAVSTMKNGEPFVEMNPDLVFIMVSNLVKNAIVHNTKGGRIIIVCTTNSINISNDGKENQSDNGSIFERYSSSDGQNSSSLGLGLSIVKSITDIYGMQINYHFDGMHTIRLQWKEVQ